MRVVREVSLNFRKEEKADKETLVETLVRGLFRARLSARAIAYRNV